MIMPQLQWEQRTAAGHFPTIKKIEATELRKSLV